MSREPKAQLHTPNELLAGASSLLAVSDPLVRRAVVLEAISALEAFVHQHVFGALEERLDPLLVRWLEQKTRMDFDSRLGVLVPIATGRAVDEKDELWERYKAAKKLRNAVTHSGRKVSHQEAKNVLQTVHDWLAYLTSSVEVDSALLLFKREVESGRIHVTDERSSVDAIARYFAGSSPAKAAIDIGIGGGIRADVVLSFADRMVVVEVKFIRRGRSWDRIVPGVRQLQSLVEQVGASKGTLVVLGYGDLPPVEARLLSLAEGKISVVSIRVPSEEG